MLVCMACEMCITRGTRTEYLVWKKKMLFAHEKPITDMTWPRVSLFTYPYRLSYSLNYLWLFTNNPRIQIITVSNVFILNSKKKYSLQMIATKCVTLVWQYLLQHIVVEAIAVATATIAVSANNVYQCDVRACWWLLPQTMK